VAARLSLFLPRFVAVTLVVLLATTTLTFAAETRTVKAPQVQPAPVAAPAPKVLVVPEVRNQVYVFAKGTLEQAGFAWRVTGRVAGYAANRVVGQSPAPGTRVLDTGSPVISLTLRTNPGYPQRGAPENSSPFPGTAVRPADLAARRLAVAKPKRSKAPKRKRAPAPKRKARKEPKARPKPVAKPKVKRQRPPAFHVPGGRREPLHEMPLHVRAKLLAIWLSSHRWPTEADVDHWSYQHAWVVAGARLGWWKGAEALETLIRVDRRVQAMWGMGWKSEALARATLAEVRAKAR
jgi:beta-lactam-binding protein with PASTA domain